MAVDLKPTMSNLQTDPFRNFKFRVAIAHPQIPGFASMGFMAVSGLSITTEVIPYREGGMNTTTQKMPGQSDFSPLTLSRGLAAGQGELWRWMKQLFVVMQGTPNGLGGKDFRQNVHIKVLEHPTAGKARAKVKAQFKVFNAWPTSVSYSDLDAGANAIIVNQMTLAHEGFDVAVARNYADDITSWEARHVGANG
jgi:phage tail-like protein